MRKLGFCLRVTSVCVLFICITIFYRHNAHTEARERFITTYSASRNVDGRHTKKIIIWKPFLRDQILQEFRGCFSNCPSKCDISDNKDDVATADAIVFHLYDLRNTSHELKIDTRDIVTLPRTRSPNQIWALFNKEPPTMTYMDLSSLNGLFNWTVWYRTDATLWWPYGTKIALRESTLKTRKHEENNPNVDSGYRSKTKEIAGMISNCEDQAQRYKLVNKLRQHLQIDMFGSCYDNACGSRKTPTEKECDKKLREYKFYLAFENSHCKDYVTEKYWESLKRNQIPIVNWKYVGDDIVIPGSYINVYDFKDIRSLATYLNSISSNETLYNSYFLWKKRYQISAPCDSCLVCNALYDPSKPPQVYSDLDSWFKDDTCPKLSELSQRMKHRKWLLYNKNGIDEE